MVTAPKKEKKERRSLKISVNPALIGQLGKLAAVLILGGGAVFYTYVGNPLAARPGLSDYDTTLQMWQEVKKLNSEKSPASKWTALGEKNKKTSAEIVARLKVGAGSSQRLAQVLLDVHKNCLPTIYRREEISQLKYEQMEADMKEAADLMAKLR